MEWGDNLVAAVTARNKSLAFTGEIAEGVSTPERGIAGIVILLKVSRGIYRTYSNTRFRYARK